MIDYILVYNLCSNNISDTDYVSRTALLSNCIYRIFCWLVEKKKLK